MLEFTRELLSAIENRQPVAVAMVTDADGASPARPGFKLLLRVDGSWLGNVGGGELEARIRRDTLDTLLALVNPARSIIRCGKKGRTPSVRFVAGR